MALGEIHDVDIVAHPGAVRRGVVIPEYRELFEFACRNLRDIRAEIVGNPVRCFPDEARLVGPEGIEIAQPRDPPVRLGSGQIPQDRLADQLGLSIDVHRRERRLLVHRQAFGIAVDRCRGGKHQGFHARGLHRFDQGDGPAHIDRMVFERNAGRFSDRLQRREMNDGLDRVLTQRPVECGAIADVGLYKSRQSSGDLLDPLERLRRRIVEIVENDRFVAGFDQRHAGVRADIAGAARYQYLRHRPSRKKRMSGVGNPRSDR